MSFDISKFYDPNTGSAMEFPVLGDFIDGTLLDFEEVPDQFKPGHNVHIAKLSVIACRINGVDLDVDDEATVKDVYLRSPGLRDAVGEAAVAAGVTALELGARLRIEYVDNKALRNGKSMKVYRGSYTAEAAF